MRKTKQGQDRTCCPPVGQVGNCCVAEAAVRTLQLAVVRVRGPEPTQAPQRARMTPDGRDNTRWQSNQTGSRTVVNVFKPTQNKQFSNHPECGIQSVMVL